MRIREIIGTAAGIRTAVRSVLRKFYEDSCFQMAASLSYSTILSLVPILTLSLSILSSLHFFDSVYEQVKQILFQFFIPSQAEIVARYIEKFTKSLASLNTVSIITFLFTGVLLMITLENNLNRIWKVKLRPGFIRNVLVYWSVLTIGPLLIGASFVLTGKVNIFSKIITIPLLSEILSFISSYLVSVIFLFLMYVFMPHMRVKKKAAILGALIAALFYEILKNYFTGYLRHMAYDKIYGSIAVLPLFLVWLYSVWIVILVGAEVAYFAHFPYKIRKTPLIENYPVLDKIKLVVYIYEMYSKDLPARFSDIVRKFYHVEPLILDAYLAEFLDLKLTVLHPDRGYIPYRNPDQIPAFDALLKTLNMDAVLDESEEWKTLVQRLERALRNEFPESMSELVR